MSGNIVIEVLFPEISGVFGDQANMRYLKCCLPQAEFVRTALTEEPYFAKNVPSLIYLGAMTEKKQELAIKKLMPYKKRLKELIAAGVPMLFTSNAVEILGKGILTEDGKIRALGLYDFFAKRQMMNRINSLLRGHFGNIEIVGFKTQFTKAYEYKNSNLFREKLFIKTDKGMGMNCEGGPEGFRDRNLFATYLVGPFLILNPDFTLYLMRDVMKIKDAELAFEDEIRLAYKRRVDEFYDPKTEY